MGDVSKDQVLRLAEEQLEVGKKLVEQGTTRMPVRVGLPKKRMPLGKPVDRLTSAR